MTNFVPREQIVASYSRLADVYAPTLNLSDLLPELPPLLCQSLALEQKPQMEHTDLLEAYVGRTRSKLDWWTVGNGHRVGLLRGEGLQDLLRELPVPGHRQARNKCHLNDLTAVALSRFAELDSERVDCIVSWTSLIVWLERLPGTVDTLLTSSTFPILPHCTFLTSKALRHIPPNSVLDRDSDYALRENLFHEALHQELAAVLLHEPVLSPNYWAATAAKIPVPWRGGAWEPDRVLHAVHVYSHLLPMRREELKCSDRIEERDWLTQATDDGTDALRYLYEQLKTCTGIFSSEGYRIFESIMASAEAALEATH